MERLDRGRRAVSDFKGRHLAGEIVLWAVRWYSRYGISYRDLEQMMAERGVSVDHSTIIGGSKSSKSQLSSRVLPKCSRYPLGFLLGGTTEGFGL
jgi:hypothetical protein